MEIIPILVKEFKHEAITTKKMLSRIPDGKFDWKPHPKSMDIRSLADHIVDIGRWPALMIQTEELDFAGMDWQPSKIDSAQQLLDQFEKNYQESLDVFSKTKESDLSGTWVLRNGEQILATNTKLEAIRVALNQTVHHRAQLGVYLRLLDVPIPGSYGPSADENQFG